MANAMNYKKYGIAVQKLLAPSFSYCVKVTIAKYLHK